MYRCIYNTRMEGNYNLRLIQKALFFVTTEPNRMGFRRAASN